MGSYVVLVNTKHNHIISIFFHRATQHTPVDLMSRMKLDRRRFETAHLRYAMLTTMATYPDIESIPMHTNVYESLKLFPPKFYECFTKRFAGTQSTQQFLLSTYYRVGYYTHSIIIQGSSSSQPYQPLQPLCPPFGILIMPITNTMIKK